MNKKMLIIEDDSTIRNEFKLYFTNRGWDVDLAADGRDGLNIIKCRAEEYKVIILDLTMPVMTGEELLEQTKKEKIDIPPFIILSAFHNKDDAIKKCIELEAKYLLKKPVIANGVEIIINYIIHDSNSITLNELVDQNPSLKLITIDYGEHKDVIVNFPRDFYAPE